MIGIINSNLISNLYLRILILILSILILLFIDKKLKNKIIDKKLKNKNNILKKIEVIIDNKKKLKLKDILNYFGYFIIMIIIPLFFDIGKANKIIKLINSLIITFSTIFSNKIIILLNFLLIIISSFFG
jgi:hypothetical protein